MGTIQHDAIIVTSWDRDKLAEAHQAAERIVGSDLTTPILAYRVNSGGSFAVLPDGSKEGWDESDMADAQRDELVLALEAFRYDDGSTPVEWIAASFGEIGHTLAFRNRRLVAPTGSEAA
jgi:hypothetical protein